jgi:hypothetical protein
MRANLLVTAALAVLLTARAEAACVARLGFTNAPFDCDVGDAISAGDLFLGGENANGKTVKYTAAQLLVFIRSQLPAVPNGTLLGGSAGAFVPLGIGSGLSNAGGTLDIANLISAGSVGGGTIVPSITFNVHGEILSTGTTVLGTAALANTGTAGATLGLLNAGLVLSGNDQFTAAVEIGSPTGGMPASGTINAQSVQQNGTQVAYAANQGAVLTNGTFSVYGRTTLACTSGGSLAIAPTTGTSDVIINLASNGGTCTLNVTPAFASQRIFLDIVQGATASTVNLNTGWVFGTTVPGYTATAIANLHDNVLGIAADTSHVRVEAIAQGFSF